MTEPVHEHLSNMTSLCRCLSTCCSCCKTSGAQACLRSTVWGCPGPRLDRPVHDARRLHQEQAVQARRVVLVQRQRDALDQAHHLANLRAAPLLAPCLKSEERLQGAQQAERS